MYLEKLTSIYNDSGCNDKFEKKYLISLNEYIEATLKNRELYVTPYKFSLDNNLTIGQAIEFFMYFTGQDKVLDLVFFFECSSPSCISSRIFLDKELLDDLDEDSEEPIICDECGREYVLNDIVSFIKAYFRIKPEMLVKEEIQKKDINSTFQAFKRLPDNLKVESPSSSIKTMDEEGDVQPLKLDQIAKNNGSSENPISQETYSFLSTLALLRHT